MKKILLIGLLVLGRMAMAQETVIHMSGEKSEYEGKSYQVVYDLKLKPGFKVKASENQKFRAWYPDVAHSPYIEDVIHKDGTITIVFKKEPISNSGLSLVSLHSGNTISFYRTINGRIMTLSPGWRRGIGNLFDPCDEIEVIINSNFGFEDGSTLGEDYSWQFSIDQFDEVPVVYDTPKEYIGINRSKAQWDKVPEAKGYRLYVYTDPELTNLLDGYDGLDIQQSSSSSVTRYTKYITMPACETYYFKVKAYNDYCESELSEVGTLYTSPYMVVHKPEENYSFDYETKDFSVDINWEPVSCADSYDVKFTYMGNTEYLATVETTNTSLTIDRTILENNGFPYEPNSCNDIKYIIIANNDYGNSGSSSFGRISFPTGPVTANVVSPEANDKMFLSWGEPPNCSEYIGSKGYMLYVSERPDFTTHVDGYEGKAVGQEYLFPAELCKTYYYRVTTVKDGVESQPSNVVEFEGQPSRPVVTEETEVTTDSFIANWETVDCADSYKLEVVIGSTRQTYYTTDNFYLVPVNNKCIDQVTYTVYSSKTYFIDVNNTPTVFSSGWSKSVDMPLDKPKNVHYGSVRSTILDLEWEANSCVEEYEVIVAEDEEFTEGIRVYKDIPGYSSGSWINSSNAKCSYFVKVKAIDGRRSAISEAIEVPMAPDDPDIRQVKGEDGTLSVEWDPVNCANGYYVTLEGVEDYQDQYVSTTSFVFSDLPGCGPFNVQINSAVGTDEMIPQQYSFISAYPDGCLTEIPDDNFETALRIQGLDDWPPDNHVLTSNVEGLLSLVLVDARISDMTGIEAFSSLEVLDLRTNDIQNIDLSRNHNLKSIDLSDNQLTSINLSGLGQLENIELYSNQLVALDLTDQVNLVNLDIGGHNDISTIDLSNQINLEVFKVYNGKFTSINLSNLTKLKVLDMSGNDLTSIDLSSQDILEELYLTFNSIGSIDLFNLSQLRKLRLSDTGLTSIDLSNQSNLQELELRRNNLTTIDLSNQDQLVEIDLWNNNLTEIDLTNNTKLEVVILGALDLVSVDLANNPLINSLNIRSNFLLTSLDVSTLQNLETLNIISNHALGCVKVSQLQLGSFVEGWEHDEGQVFNLDCGSTSSRVIQEVKEEENAEYSTMQLFPNPTEDFFTIAVPEYEGAVLQIFDIAGMRLSDKLELHDHETVIDAQDLPKGIVIVRVTAGETVSTMKLMIK